MKKISLFFVAFFVFELLGNTVHAQVKSTWVKTVSDPDSKSCSNEYLFESSDRTFNIYDCVKDGKERALTIQAVDVVKKVNLFITIKDTYGYAVHLIKNDSQNQMGIAVYNSLFKPGKAPTIGAYLYDDLLKNLEGLPEDVSKMIKNAEMKFGGNILFPTRQSAPKKDSSPVTTRGNGNNLK